MRIICLLERGGEKTFSRKDVMGMGIGDARSIEAREGIDHGLGLGLGLGLGRDREVQDLRAEREDIRGSVMAMMAIREGGLIRDN